jgi:ectoine hydroxylase-related dioxygenase (phytanoyl-CoA dioxygenase family)
MRWRELTPVSPLPAAIAAALDREGYVILRDMATPEWLEAVRARLDELEVAEGTNAAKEHHQEEGAGRLANLVNKGRVFEHAWCNPLLLACCAHMFQRPFKLSSLNGREAKLGGGHQPLHGDWRPPRGDARAVHVCNGLWAIDDLRRDNGASRLVPGSHLLPGKPEEMMADPNAPHPREIIAEVPAGSVVMRNAHTWHGGTNNTSGARRRVLHACYTAREHPQQQDQRRWLLPETRAWLTPAQRELLDVE